MTHHSGGMRCFKDCLGVIFVLVLIQFIADLKKKKSLNPSLQKHRTMESASKSKMNKVWHFRQQKKEEIIVIYV